MRNVTPSTTCGGTTCAASEVPDTDAGCNAYEPVYEFPDYLTPKDLTDHEPRYSVAPYDKPPPLPSQRGCIDKT